MPYRPDIVVTDRFGVPVALVEVKVLTGAAATVPMATRYMRNLLSHGDVPPARFLMLISQDTGYVWFSPEDVLRKAAPIMTFPMDGIVQHFLPRAGQDEPVSGLVLEAIVQQWLWNVVGGDSIDEVVTNRLDDAGFLTAVRDGHVSAPTRV